MFAPQYQFTILLLLLVAWITNSLISLWFSHRLQADVYPD